MAAKAKKPEREKKPEFEGLVARLLLEAESYPELGCKKAAEAILSLREKCDKHRSEVYVIRKQLQKIARLYLPEETHESRAAEIKAVLSEKIFCELDLGDGKL